MRNTDRYCASEDFEVNPQNVRKRLYNLTDKLYLSLVMCDANPHDLRQLKDLKVKIAEKESDLIDTAKLSSMDDVDLIVWLSQKYNLKFEYDQRK